MLRRLLPHPLRSLALVLLWLMLNNSLDPGHVVLGAAIGWAVPLATRRFWPESVGLRRPGRALAFIGLVTFDIVVANLRVARAVLGPVRRLRPGFAEVPVDLTSDFAITLLAQTITLTPGTISADLSPDRRRLVVHYLDEADPAAVVATIKQRYERPLMEIFG
jgi:multicomponent K+:H+ antiporter subunit E